MAKGICLWLGPLENRLRQLCVRDFLGHVLQNNTGKECGRRITRREKFSRNAVAMVSSGCSSGAPELGWPFPETRRLGLHMPASSCHWGYTREEV